MIIRQMYSILKNGPFSLAIDKKVAVMPASSLNIWKILCDSGFKYGSQSGVCEIYLHKPIPTYRLETDDAGKLHDRVKNIIRQKIEKAQ
jgi:1-acyl-sn-glycerol-3-phosphate acyltransferase